MQRLHNAVLMGALGLVVVAVGCGGAGATQHPLTNELDKSFETLKITTLASLPFASDISEADDPDKLSASMFESKFFQALGGTTGFSVYSSGEVGREVTEHEMQARMQAFYKKWISDPSDVDAGFIKEVATMMKADAVIAGAVDVWYQRHIDLTETGSARTTVGAFVGIFDGATGKRLWLGRDENFREAVRHTARELDRDVDNRAARGEMERTNLRTATGVYAPPDYKEVVDLVVGALVQAFPKRVP